VARLTRKIGLSLGADTCWPICFEDLIKDLDVVVKTKQDEVRFEVERIAIEPYDLRAKVDYDLIVDRLTHWYAPAREWIKKAILMDGAYTWNNPWSIESNQKHTAYAAMQALGLPIPETWMIPAKAYEPKPDLQVTLERYAKLFDLGKVGKEVGYPCFMKPFDGGGWVGVTKCDDEPALRDAYEKSGKSLMHVQKGVVPFERFVRCVGLGPQTLLMNYDPDAPLHDRYRVDTGFVTQKEQKLIEDITLTINAFFGWDFNSCEALLQKGTWYPIDFANPCPDSQVTSLHYHFPSLVKAKLRWALFVAATKRKMRMNLDWAPYFAVQAKKLPLPEAIAEYGKLARAHFEAERFEEFCATNLGKLDQAAWEYFGSPRAKAAVRKKVEMVFPKHEWDRFTDHFFGAFQRWREDDRRPGTSRASRSPSRRRPLSCRPRARRRARRARAPRRPRRRWPTPTPTPAPSAAPDKSRSEAEGLPQEALRTSDEQGIDPLALAAPRPEGDPARPLGRGRHAGPAVPDRGRRRRGVRALPHDQGAAGPAREAADQALLARLARRGRSGSRARTAGPRGLRAELLRRLRLPRGRAGDPRGLQVEGHRHRRGRSVDRRLQRARHDLPPPGRVLEGGVHERHLRPVEEVRQGPEAARLPRVLAARFHPGAA
jgi:hypothetical protein